MCYLVTCILDLSDWAGLYPNTNGAYIQSSCRFLFFFFSFHKSNFIKMPALCNLKLRISFTYHIVYFRILYLDYSIHICFWRILVVSAFFASRLYFLPSSSQSRTPLSCCCESSNKWMNLLLVDIWSVY